MSPHERSTVRQTMRERAMRNVVRGKRSSAAFTPHEAQRTVPSMRVSRSPYGSRLSARPASRSSTASEASFPEENLEHAVAGDRVHEPCGVADQRGPAAREREAGERSGRAVRQAFEVVVGNPVRLAEFAQPLAEPRSSASHPPSPTFTWSPLEHPAVAARDDAELEHRAPAIVVSGGGRMPYVAFHGNSDRLVPAEPERPAADPVDAVGADERRGVQPLAPAVTSTPSGPAWACSTFTPSRTSAPAFAACSSR